MLLKKAPNSLGLDRAATAGMCYQEPAQCLVHRLPLLPDVLRFCVVLIVQGPLQLTVKLLQTAPYLVFDTLRGCSKLSS